MRWESLLLESPRPGEELDEFKAQVGKQEEQSFEADTAPGKADNNFIQDASEEPNPKGEPLNIGASVNMLARSTIITVNSVSNVVDASISSLQVTEVVRRIAVSLLAIFVARQ